MVGGIAHCTRNELKGILSVNRLFDHGFAVSPGGNFRLKGEGDVSHFCLLFYSAQTRSFITAFSFLVTHLEIF